MKCNKEVLINKLKRDGIIISNDKLDIVINIYNHFILYLGENQRIGITKRFDFISGDNTDISKSFYTIFKQLIYFQKKGILNYLDYALINDYLGYYRSTSTIYDFIWYCLDYIIDTYKQAKKNFVYALYQRINDTIENAVFSRADFIRTSKYISDDYKKIFNKFYDIFNKYRNEYEIRMNRLYKKDFEEYGVEKVFFDDYINFIYFYFLSKNIIINDLNRAYEFLDYIYNNMARCIDQVNLVGIKNDQDLYLYIDILYKNFNANVKIIK